MTTDQTTYAFVDLGYLLAETDALCTYLFGAVERRLDMLRLKRRLPRASRMFVYYAAEVEFAETDKGITHADRDAQKLRMASDLDTIAWLEAEVARLDGVHVRWGEVKHRSKRRGGRTQKGVDLMLGVDMMKFAFGRTIQHAMLFVGDLDFLPLVQAVVEIGCHVTVASSPRSAAAQLVNAADYRIDLDGAELFDLVRPDLLVRTGSQTTSRCSLIAEGASDWAWFGSLDAPEKPDRPAVFFGHEPPQHRAWHLADAGLLKQLALREIGADSFREVTAEERARFAHAVASR